jgi:spectinomycin phosphotransferase
VVRRIHASQLPVALSALVPREDFVPNRQWSAVVRRLYAEIPTRDYEHVFARELAAFWRERHAEIGAIVARAEALGRRLQAAPPPFVLCHADIHKGNLLLAPDGGLFVVDWDQPILAPKERDLMFVIGGAVDGVTIGPREEELFFRGYGGRDVNPLALAYYYTDWAVQDMGAYAERVFLAPDAGQVTRRESVDGFKSLFTAGHIVDVARRTDVVLD